MRCLFRSFAASSLLGSTLVYAMPSPSVDSQSRKQILDKRSPQDSDIHISSGFAAPVIPDPTPSPNQNQSNNQGSGGSTVNPDTLPSPNPAAVESPNASLTQAHDTLTDASTNLYNDIHTTSGYTTLSAGSDGSFPIVQNRPSSPTSSTSSTATPQHSSLAPPPSQSSSTNHGLLIGIVVGGLILGFAVLTVGLWLCYRRRGPTSGASTPKYDTAVSGDEKPSFFAFLRSGPRKWKKGHLRVKSSQSFASPMIANDPKLMEEVARTRTRTLSMKSPPVLPAHLTGSTAGASGTVTGRDRWSTFSSSDGGSVPYPQTPVGTTRLDGIIMETVVETDAHSNLHTPIGGIQTHQTPLEYLNLKRTPSDDRSPFDSRLPLVGLGGTRSSFFRDENDLSTPTTPTSSGGLTYGSNGRPRRTSDRYTFTQPLLTTSAVTPNVSYPTISTQHQASSTTFLSGANANALVATRPKFNPIHSNKSGANVSVGGGSGASGDTIRITNPFLGGDEDDLSSYGHGLLEIEDNEGLRKGEEDARSLHSMDSGIFAYPSSTGCLPKPSPSPNHLANPLHGVNLALIDAEGASTSHTHPRSSLISDTSSEYPYPLGYAIDHEGNAANPFLRISEILEEVDGRMRWPSPPLLPRSESQNY